MAHQQIRTAQLDQTSPCGVDCLVEYNNAEGVLRTQLSDSSEEGVLAVVVEEEALALLADSSE